MAPLMKSSLILLTFITALCIDHTRACTTNEDCGSGSTCDIDDLNGPPGSCSPILGHRCSGLVLNAYACPAGYYCRFLGIPDAGGVCELSCTNPVPSCPPDESVQECIHGSNQCVPIEGHVCEGYLFNAFHCPGRFTCQIDPEIPDLPGVCVRTPCNGPQDCNSGESCVNQQCVEPTPTPTPTVTPTPTPTPTVTPTPTPTPTVTPTPTPVPTVQSTPTPLATPTPTVTPSSSSSDGCPGKHCKGVSPHDSMLQFTSESASEQVEVAVALLFAGLVHTIAHLA